MLISEIDTVLQLTCEVVNEANPSVETTAIAMYHVTCGVDSALRAQLKSIALRDSMER